MVKVVKHTARWRRQVMWHNADPNDVWFVLGLCGVVMIPWLLVIYLLWHR